MIIACLFVICVTVTVKLDPQVYDFVVKHVQKCADFRLCDVSFGDELRQVTAIAKKAVNRRVYGLSIGTADLVFVVLQFSRRANPPRSAPPWFIKLFEYSADYR